MQRKIQGRAGLAAAVLAILAVLGTQSSGEAAETPPISGWMKNFSVAETPAAAPETPMVGKDGAKKTLKDWRGKVVLVNFWATWCGPCIREMPSLLRLHKQLSDEGFAVLAVSQDRKGWGVIPAFVKKYDLADLPIYHDERLKMALSLKVRGLPTSVLVDKQGQVVGRLPGHAEWDTPEAIALIKHYLAKN